MTDDNNHNNGGPKHPSLIVLWERQRIMQKRLEEIEKKQAEAEKLVNRYMGGIALLIGVGLFIGWIVTLGSGVLQVFRR